MTRNIAEIVRETCAPFVDEVFSLFRNELNDIIAQGMFSTTDILSLIDDCEGKMSDRESGLADERTIDGILDEADHQCSEEDVIEAIHDEFSFFADSSDILGDVLDGFVSVAVPVLHPRDLSPDSDISEEIREELSLRQEHASLSSFAGAMDMVYLVVEGNLGEFVDEGDFFYVNDPVLECGCDTVELIGETVRVYPREATITYTDPWE